jgi:hypothetical protein
MGELEIRELRERNPAELIMFVRRLIPRFSEPSVDDEDRELNAVRLQGDPGSSGRDVRLDTELFPELPHQRLLQRFTFIDVTAGDVPDTRICLAVATSMTEQHSPAMTQNSSSDAIHSKIQPVESD